MKIKGDKKANKLIGSENDDTILGKGGNDKIVATGGHDTVDAGGGNDKITITADTSANIDAGKGNDTVKISAGALGSEINLGKGNDVVDIKDSTVSGQSFVIAGGTGNDAVNFALNQNLYTVVKDGDEAYTVTDANGNTYVLTSISSLTFDGALYVEPGNPINQAPIVANQIADQAATAQTVFSFQIAANAFTDPDADALTYSATLADGSALPSWLTFDGTTRTFSGSPPVDSVGAVSVRVSASDGSLAAFDDFTITINAPAPPPILDPVVTGGVLFLTSPYDYDVSEAGGVLTVSYQGRTSTYSNVTGVNTVGSNSVDVATNGWVARPITGDVNYIGVTFNQAGPGAPDDIKFDASFELGPDFIPTNGTATVNGTMADYFRAAWDWLDDQYTQSPGNYYAEQLNSFGIDLGIQYALYLKNGGAPLFDIAKYTKDGADGGTAPDRMQTLHDNLLGNLDENSIVDKFNAKPVGAEFYEPTDVFKRITDAGLSDYLGVIGNIHDGRGIFTGNETDLGSAAHDRVRGFDYEKGINRSDYIEFTADGIVDPKAQNGNEMWFGDGNLTSNWVIERHVGANVETALKIHYRQGSEVDPIGTAPDGAILFNVDEGSQTAGSNGASSTAATRSAWNFDYSVTTGINGTPMTVDELRFELKVDTDSSAGVDYMIFRLEGGGGITPFVAKDDQGNVIGVSGEHPTSGDGTLPYIAQDSVNFGFGFIKDAIDSGSGYDFGEGIFDIELSAYDKDDGDLVSSVHIRVVVDDNFVI